MDNKNEQKNIKNEIKKYENKIAETKEVVKRLNKMEDDFILLDDSFGKCLDILRQSVNGHKANMILSDSFDFKNKCINDSLHELSKSKSKFSNIVNQYIKTKEKLEDAYSKQISVNNKN